MRELTARITALAPEAADALKTIAYFDELSQHNAGVKSILRAAAALARVPVSLIDRTGGASIHITTDGISTDIAEEMNPSWPRAITEDGALEILLERATPSETQLDALVAERALLAVAVAIGRPSDGRPRDENVAVRTAVDPKATPQLRHQALSRLGLAPDAIVCVIAVHGTVPMIARTLDEARSKAASVRAGIGPLVTADEAPLSWKRAWSALALTAEGTTTDPGDRIITADEAGTLIWLVDHTSHFGDASADVSAISTHAAAAPWLLETLHAVSTTDSIREAASALGFHHSTVQERATRASHLLGWDITHQRGKLRTQLALMLRRIGNAQSTEHGT